MLSNKRIAVAILNYNGTELLKKFLPSVVKHSDKKLSRIFVIDNNSNDESVIFISKSYPDIEIVKNDKNYGYAGGYNEGLKNIDSDYFVLLNNDVEVTKNWLNPMFELLESDETFATCQPKIKYFKNKKLFDYAGGAGGFIDFLGYPFCRGRIFDFLEEDYGQYDDLKEVFWTSGCCFMVKSKIFKKLGGFDKDFFAHMEEIDLCWRLKNLQYKNFCQPKSVIYHSGGETLNKKNPKKTFLNFRNNLIMILKNDMLIVAFLKIFIRFFLDILASIKISFDNKNIAHIGSVIRAYFEVILKIPITILKRRVSILKYSKPKGIILPFKYFIMKKKRFSDL
tara:strand:+ start:1281 stop:2294 length:1014 start_codon:yes stop_codon:yes gene_type:complete